MFARAIWIPMAGLCALLWVAAPPMRAGDDPKEIVRRALRNDARNRELEHRYTYVKRDDMRDLNGAGAVTHRDSKTWEVIPVGESRFRRLIEHDGRPPSAKEQRQQEALQRKREAERRKTEDLRARETPEARQKRLDAKERSRGRARRERDEALDGMDLRLVGEELIDGVPVWAIDGAPRPGYKFKSTLVARIIGNMKGRIWVAKDSYQPVRIDAETTGTISLGGVLARVQKGTRVHTEFTYVNGEVWLPKLVSFRLSARFMLLKGVHGEGEFAFSDHKKFTVDSRFVEDE